MRNHSPFGAEGGEEMLELMILGGNRQVGQMNAYALRDRRTGYSLVVDFGAEFAGENGEANLLRIPDVSCLDPTKTAIVISHAHYDHWLGLKVLASMPDWQGCAEMKLVAPPFALGLIREQLFNDEAAPCPAWELRKARSGETVFRRGPFEVRWFSVIHSTPQSCGIEVTWRESCHGPLRVVYTGDFVPASWVNEVKKKPDVLLLDSTGSLHDGHTPLEEACWPNLEGLVSRVGDDDCQRMIATLFSTNISRLGYLVQCVRRHRLKYALLGRALQEAVDVAHRCRLEEAKVLNEYPPVSAHGADVLFVTGCQAEERSALWRMVYERNGYPESLFEGDLLVNASSCIPGNEKRVRELTERALARGAQVVLDVRGVKMNDDEVERLLISPSGHATLPDLLSVAKEIGAQTTIPVHGDQEHRSMLSAGLGKQGLKARMLEDGESWELS